MQRLNKNKYMLTISISSKKESIKQLEKFRSFLRSEMKRPIMKRWKPMMEEEIYIVNSLLRALRYSMIPEPYRKALINVGSRVLNEVKQNYFSKFETDTGDYLRSITMGKPLPLSGLWRGKGAYHDDIGAGIGVGEIEILQMGTLLTAQNSILHDEAKQAEFAIKLKEIKKKQKEIPKRPQPKEWPQHHALKYKDAKKRFKKLKAFFHPRPRKAYVAMWGPLRGMRIMGYWYFHEAGFHYILPPFSKEDPVWVHKPIFKDVDLLLYKERLKAEIERAIVQIGQFSRSRWRRFIWNIWGGPSHV